MVFHRVLSEWPPNVGVDVSGLDGYSLTQRQMFLRCNYPVPSVLPGGFNILMPNRPARTVTPEAFLNYRDVEIDMVLECAGNGRSLMEPVPGGTPWGLGGVSPITVGGVRLADVLGDIPDSVVDLVFTGADGYQFSLDREMALSRRPILANRIGGDPLDTQHGAPVRLVVPGHYAMKSVKWLMSIEGVPYPFRGQLVQEYRYHEDTSEPEGEPVADIAVRSIISSPVDGDTFTERELDVRGSAWSGNGEILWVEVSIDGGNWWEPANLIVREVGGRFAPVRWAVTFGVEPGTVEIMARATDATRETQPLEPRWNTGGYANNVVHRITVEVS